MHKLFNKIMIRNLQSKLYIAGALFNGREARFNLDLVKGLEKKNNYKILLPQRDGFEFEHLASLLEKKIPANEVTGAMNSIIYVLDMGLFLANSEWW